MVNSAEKFLFGRAAIIGVGLIGSSLARAFRDNNVAREIIGVDVDKDVLRRAAVLEIFDQTKADIAAVADADLIVIATPVGVMGDVINSVAAHVSSGALVIDVGSVKASVAAAAAHLPDDVFFVPCHPIAGTEQSGPEAGFATLFRNRWSIITPLVGDGAPYLSAVDKAKALWTAIGSNVEVMSPERHDLALAVTSHLPHLIAFTMVGAADDIENVEDAEVIKYSAGGFRDFTRIAASNPVMWRDVFLHNKDAVLDVLGRFNEELTAMQNAIQAGDGDALYTAFERSRTVRKAIIDAGQETDQPNWGRDGRD